MYKSQLLLPRGSFSWACHAVIVVVIVVVVVVVVVDVVVVDVVVLMYRRLYVTCLPESVRRMCRTTACCALYLFVIIRDMYFFGCVMSRSVFHHLATSLHDSHGFCLDANIPPIQTSTFDLCSNLSNSCTARDGYNKVIGRSSHDV